MGMWYKKREMEVPHLEPFAGVAEGDPCRLQAHQEVSIQLLQKHANVGIRKVALEVGGLARLQGAGYKKSCVEHRMGFTLRIKLMQFACFPRHGTWQLMAFSKSMPGLAQTSNSVHTCR